MSADGRRIYLGRVSRRAREKDIERFFKGYGRLADVILKNGFAFIDFEDRRDAEDAAYELNGKTLCGERVIVEIARGTPHGRDKLLDYQKRGGDYRGGDRDRDRDRGDRDRGRDKYGPSTRTDYRLVVDNLSSRVSWQDLKDFMRQAGEVTYSSVDVNRRQGLVEFASKSDMLKALDKFDGVELSGRKLKIRQEKGGSRSVSRSRTRSRSKSSDKNHRSRSRSRSRSGSKRRRRSSSGSPRLSGSRTRKESETSPPPKKKEASRSPSREAASPAPARSRSRSKSEASRNGSEHANDSGVEQRSNGRRHSGGSESDH